MSHPSEAPSLRREGARKFRVERATGPFCRATSPTAERTKISPSDVEFVRTSRRQVAAENGQAGGSWAHVTLLGAVGARMVLSPSPRPSPLGRGRTTRRRSAVRARVERPTHGAFSEHGSILEARTSEPTIRSFKRRPKRLPLPEGEGWGEEEGHIPVETVPPSPSKTSKLQCRAASPAAGRLRQLTSFLRLVRYARRQVAAEDGQVGRSTQTSSTTVTEAGTSWVVATSTNFAIAPGSSPPNSSH
jgi:hypothetical protein